MNNDIGIAHAVQQLDVLNGSFFMVLPLYVCTRLEEVISKLGLQKGSVLRHMSTAIQPILEKGIVDHSIIHRVLIEYLGVADKVVIFM